MNGGGAIAKRVCSLIKFRSLIMAISFPNRNEKLASQIRDGLRILAWQEYKNDNKSELKGLELYEVFKEEWEAHEIHKMNLNKLQKFISELGYSQSDIAQIRGDYYRSRNEYKANNSVNNNSEELETAPF